MEGITNELILQLWKDCDGEPHEGYDLEVIEEGDWEINFKDYQDKSTYVRHVPTGRFFCINEHRSGSYYSDYYYDAPDAVEVVQKEVTITQWVVKK